MEDPEELESRPVPPVPNPEDGDMGQEESIQEEPTLIPGEGDPLSSLRDSLEEPSDPDEKAPFSRRFMEWLADSPSGRQPAPAQDQAPAGAEPLQEQEKFFEDFDFMTGEPLAGQKGGAEQGTDFEAATQPDELEAPEDTAGDESDLGIDEDATVRILRDDLRGEEDRSPPTPTPDEETPERRSLRAFLFGRGAERGTEEGISDEELQRRLAADSIEVERTKGEAAAGEAPEQGEAGPISPFSADSLFSDESPFIEAGYLQADLTEEQEKLEEGRQVPGWFQEAEISAAGEPEREESPELPEDLPGGLLAGAAADAEPGAEQPRDDYQELRELALEDYVETVEPKPRPSLSELAGGWWRGLGSLQKGFLIGLILLNLVLVTVGVIMLLQAFASGAFPLRSATATAAPTSVLPYPVEVRLPGGWPIGLKAATILDGAWAPEGPEWLQGTEIRRWIAIPWSKELEAVFKAILPGDTVILKMSNRDEWTYKVQSVERVASEKLPELNQNVSSVLIFLADKSSDQRWVLIASQ